MKKILLSIFSIIIFCSPLLAQETPGKFSVGISGGAAIPLGKFASLDTSIHTSAGWAKMGIAINLSIDYQLTRKTGIILLLGGQQNKQDPTPTKERLTKNSGQNTVHTMIKNGHWRIGKIMAGGVFETPVSASGKLNFQCKVLAGVCKTAIPGYKFSALYETPDNMIMTTGASAGSIPLPWTFCYQGSVGLKYRLTRTISFNAEVAYFGANPAIEQWFYPDEGDIIIGQLRNIFTSTTIRYSLSTISPTAGIAFSF